MAQNIKERELKTSINEVTVFLDGAQIFESGSAAVPAGESLLRIRNLSPHLDDKSIQIRADGNFTILSVNHKFNFIQSLKKDLVIDSLGKQRDAISALIAQEENRLEVLREKQSVLNANKNLSGTSGVSLAQLKQAMDFYDAELSRIKDEESKLRKSITIRKELETRIQQQLKEQHDKRAIPSSEIEIRVNSEQPGNGKFFVNYLVANAGWFPKYDVRVKTVNDPLDLRYKAEVFQNTGVDWKNVKLRFSNGTPNQSGLAPELSVWLLNYARNTVTRNALHINSGTVRGTVVDDTGSPMPGVNVVIRGTTIGTATDASGRFSLTLPGPNAVLVVSFVGYASQELAVTNSDMRIRLAPDVRQLDEVVTTGYAIRGISGRSAGLRIRGMASMAKDLETTVVENQTTVEFVVDEPYTIKSNGEKLMVDLKRYQITASYEYYAVPKIDKDAFLVARIVDWDQYNLLEGEANLYFEDAFVGKSVLNAKALTDTLSISLGRDKNILVSRSKIEQFSKKRTLGSNITETRGIRILVRNKKSQSVKLTVFDQIPVSILSDISVNTTSLGAGDLENRTGKVTWIIQLEPQQQKEIDLQYEVKYPKREKVLLE